MFLKQCKSHNVAAIHKSYCLIWGHGLVLIYGPFGTKPYRKNKNFSPPILLTTMFCIVFFFLMCVTDTDLPGLWENCLALYWSVAQKSWGLLA